MNLSGYSIKHIKNMDSVPYIKTIKQGYEKKSSLVKKQAIIGNNILNILQMV